MILDWDTISIIIALGAVVAISLYSHCRWLGGKEIVDNIRKERRSAKNNKDSMRSNNETSVAKLK